jgi:hypothetical protein
MPNQHHHDPRNGRRDVRNEPSDIRGAEQRRLQPEPQRTTRSAGGRTENFSRQRDAEQLRAGYSPGEWDRQEPSHNTRSEPDWDPDRGFARSGDRWEEERHDGSPRYDRNENRPAGRGYETRGYQGGYQRDFEPGRYDEREGARHLPDWGPQRSEARHDDTRRGEHGRLGQQLSDAGRNLIGKVKRLVRNPKNYRRSDERIREDICDRLAVSDEVDPSDIEVTVSNGEVTLTGTVQTRQMKFIAEETADEVAGVHDVHNQLRVARGT